MKKVMVSLASLVISLVLCGRAQAQAHRNAYGGGSTSHSGEYHHAHQRLRWQRNSHCWTGNLCLQRIWWLCLSCARIWKDDCH